MRIVTVTQGFQMVVLGADDFVSKDIANRGYWEMGGMPGMGGMGGMPGMGGMGGMPGMM
jgi:hypothetical protein